MKKILFGTLVMTVLFSVTSCVKVNFNEGDGVQPPPDPTSNVITGKITTSRFYAKGTYILKGYVYVTEGATLTFEAGCVIKSDITEKGALIIERGAKLIADGTAANPIVFTSGKDAGQRAPGDWGGIILLGKAPTNRPLDPAPVIEGGVGRQYGGTDPLDESGIIRFVRIEWAGIAAEPGSEINGLTCGGVPEADRLFDGELPAVRCLDRAEDRRDRGEGVLGDLRLRVRDAAQREVDRQREHRERADARDPAEELGRLGRIARQHVLADDVEQGRDRDDARRGS
ncbi:MAG: hypothetical protein HC867_02640, partial [Bacteroidia bacterium]|nr:hypothetical protein [Bacteroidia bacterium]